MTTNETKLNLSSWKAFRNAQSEAVLPTGSAVKHMDVKVRYIDAGKTNAETVLLMHGIPTWGYLYNNIIPPLLEAGYRVVAPDFLGHGWSDRRDRFDRSFQDQARMISALLHHLKLEKVHVVGHDTGGAVALILAIEYSHLVDRLVVCNSVCYDRFDDDMLDLGHPLRWKPRSVADLVAALDESLEAGLSRSDRLTPEFRDGIIAPWASEEGKLSLIRNAAALNANQTMALVDRHSTIEAKTLVLWAVDDPWQKPGDGKQLSTEIPGAAFVTIQGASHWIQQDSPEEFTKAVLDFLQKGN